MKLAKSSLSGASLAVLIIQLLLVSSIGAKYLYQRRHCARVWTRAAIYDPSLVMRGRYLSMQLMVDGCQSTLPSAKQAQFPRNVNGVPNGLDFSVGPNQVAFSARLFARNNKLIAIRIPDTEDGARGEDVFATNGAACDQMRLSNPVPFYLAENGQSPLPVKPGQELWVEVTVPPQGPPRPIQLALKEKELWKPLGHQ